MVEYFRQCMFKTVLNKFTHGWIEEKYAKKGSIVSFKDSPNIKWEIVNVGDQRITKENADKQCRAHLHQRSVSDI